MNKDIGLIQQHAEKLVLGLAILFAVGVGLYFWVLGDPHGTPGQAVESVENATQRLNTKINSDEVPAEMEEYAIPDFATRFQTEYAKKVTDVTQLASRPDSLGISRDVINVEKVDYDPLYLPTPPMADAFNIKFAHAVLAEPGEVSDGGDREFVSNVREIIGDQTPSDFQYVSVMTEFPLRAWADRLDVEPPSATDSIPENVWRSRLGIASVYLIRERQDPATGVWVERTKVDPLPEVNALAEIPFDALNELDALTRTQVLEAVRANQAEIAQANFPPIRGAWLPPIGENRILSPEQQAELEDIEGEIKKLQRQLDRLRGVDDASTERRRQPRATSTRGDAGGGYGGYGEGGGTQRTTRNTNTDRNAEREAREREAQERRELEVQDQLEAKRQERFKLLGIEEDDQQRSFLSGRSSGGYGEGGYGQGGYGQSYGAQGGYGQGGYGGAPGGEFARNPGGQGQGGPEDQVPETLRVWAHDLTAVPGETYRYKLVVAVINPLFQYTRLPEDQRRANEYKLALSPSEAEIDAAPWTTPVTLDPQSYFFFVRGNPSQSRATVEVWRVYNGQWRSAEFDELPGNPIGGVERVEVNGRRRSVDMLVGAVLLEIDSVQTANNQTQTRMVYMLPDGQIASRTLTADKRSTKREELQADLEAQNQEPVALRN